jgi:hypothetical protein
MSAAIKVVINTHPRYTTALDILMRSLNYGEHLADIVLVVADVPASERDCTVAEYRKTYGSDLVVLTDEANIAEYTSFLALGKALARDASQSLGDYFLMIHDTCEVGRMFWWKLERLHARIHSFELVKDPNIDGCYHVCNDHALQVSVPPCVYTIRQFSYMHQRLVCLCGGSDGAEGTFVGFVDPHGDITPRESEAHVFTFTDDEEPGAEALVRQLRKQDVWFPLTEHNFNIGIASRAFLVEHAMPAFAAMAGTPIFKEEAIDIELNIKHPKNLRRLAGTRWRYLYKNLLHEPVPLFSIWRNDTDVYGNGNLRNVAYIHVLDLKKYTYLVGEKWASEHMASA